MRLVNAEKQVFAVIIYYIILYYIIYHIVICKDFRDKTAA